MADDAVAEAFARVIAQGDTVRDPVAYLYRVAFRVAAAELKRRAAETDLGASYEPASTGSEDGVVVWRTLALLPPEQRAALYLFYRADLPAREIARRLGTSSAAVRMNLMRGRRRLASVLQEDE